jgi:hypothetical protein
VREESRDTGYTPTTGNLNASSGIYVWGTSTGGPMARKSFMGQTEAHSRSVS